jgi:cobaltochelatase CobT
MSGDSAFRALQAWPAIYAGTPGVSVAHADRSRSDAHAAWQRWHDAQADALFTVLEQPWYRVIEQARVDTLASQHLPGMAHNLACLPPLPNALSPAAHLYQCARIALAGDALGEGQWQVPDQAAGHWLSRLLERGRQRQLQQLRALLPILLSEALLQLADAQAFARVIKPLVEAYARTFASVQPLPTLPMVAGATAEGRENLPSRPVEQWSEQQQAPYRVFSQAWDEVLGVRELRALAQQPQVALSDEVQAQARRLAQQLRKRLQSLQQHRWRFDQSEGMLDARRLTSVVTSANTAIFRQPQQAPLTDACISLLLDQSGSMRGLPQQMTLLAVDLAVRVLEAAGVSCEVLGYGTRYAGQDNPVHDAWLAAGRPALPGRLNATRYLVYKSVRQPWRASCGLLMRQAPLAGENIDGEALLWTASRLLKQPQRRKILLVFCDGAPHDEATVAANGPDYLRRHLHQSIAMIERGPIHLAAIGMGQGIAHYYRNSLRLQGPEAIFGVLFEQLPQLLEGLREERFA